MNADPLCRCGHMMSSHGPHGCEVQVSDHGDLDCKCLIPASRKVDEDRYGLVALQARNKELEDENARLRALAEKVPCECYDEPTLVATDHPTSVECERCRVLGTYGDIDSGEDV